jgi:hypothetical protein
MGPETENRKPVAVFMAFGTKGDVYPLSVSTSSSNGIAKISPLFFFFSLSSWVENSRICCVFLFLFQAIAAAFASDQKQYRVVLVTHSAHQVCIEILLILFGLLLTKYPASNQNQPCILETILYIVCSLGHLVCKSKKPFSRVALTCVWTA